MSGLRIGPQLMDDLSAGRSPPEGKGKGKGKANRKIAFIYTIHISFAIL